MRLRRPVVWRIPIAYRKADLTRLAPGDGTSTATPLHVRPLAVLLVMSGGVVGAAARETVELAVPTSKQGFPVATFAINLCGAFALGVVLDALVRSGDDVGWRRKTRLVVGTGFCGAFTTYSTLAVESVQLARHGAWSVGVLYVVASLVGGLAAAALGIAAGARHTAWSVSELPVDPDVDRIERGR